MLEITANNYFLWTSIFYFFILSWGFCCYFDVRKKRIFTPKLGQLIRLAFFGYQQFLTTIVRIFYPRNFSEIKAQIYNQLITKKKFEVVTYFSSKPISVFNEYLQWFQPFTLSSDVGQIVFFLSIINHLVSFMSTYN